jgi:GDP/UDP-N,N'-diacetylbacillosamine 2-epimerase (hydrolysing)
MRKVCYVTGTRADFGLMQNTLQAIHVHSQLSLSLLVTGMHLLSCYGETWREIAADGLPIGAKISVNLSGSSGAEMSIALGEQVIGFTKALQQINPDLVLLLGDRGEMLAGAIAALHLNIPIVHIHGGELSGTIDESVRHAISKIAHYHFTATTKSRERLIRMGETGENIFVTGAPGLDAVYQLELLDRVPLFADYGLNHERPLLLILFHPVVQQAKDSAEQMRALLDAALEGDIQSLVIMPNADSGGLGIAEVIRDYSPHQLINTAVHVPRREFISLMAHAEVLVGNSSSGIIEATSLNTPVVNIGNRQRCRERNPNVIDVAPVKSEIVVAITKAREMKGQRWRNVYGEGGASARIVECLATLPLSPEVLEKVNAY